MSRTSYDYKIECLARYVRRLPTLAARRAWLQRAEQRHGLQAVDMLKAEMIKQEEKRTCKKAR